MKFLSRDKVTAPLVENLFKNKTGLVAKSIDFVPKGESSIVYKITDSEQNIFYFRFSKINIVDYKAELEAMEKAASQGVKVAKVIVADKHEFENGVFPYSIQTAVSGKAYDYDVLSLEKWESILTEVGLILNQINQVPAQFFGKLNRTHEERFESYFDYLRIKYINRPEAIEFIVGNIAEQNSEDVALVKKIFAKQSYLFANEVNVFSHGDYGMDHVFVNENQEITGIIDWGECGGYTKYHDFAKWDYYHASKLPLKYLISGYGNKSIFDQSFYPKISLIKLQVCLESIWWYNHIKSAEALEFNVGKLRALLQEYKSSGQT